jgi:hypothetical protein
VTDLDLVANLFDEPVVDAIVSESTHHGATSRAYGQTQPWHPEQETNQHTLERPAQSAGSDQVDRLFDLYLAILPPYNDGGVSQVDELPFLQLDHLVAHLFRAYLVFECEDYQCFHLILLCLFLILIVL